MGVSPNLFKSPKTGGFRGFIPPAEQHRWLRGNPGFQLRQGNAPATPQHVIPYLIRNPGGIVILDSRLRGNDNIRATSHWIAGGRWIKRKCAGNGSVFYVGWPPQPVNGGLCHFPRKRGNYLSCWVSRSPKRSQRGSEASEGWVAPRPPFPDYLIADC